MSAIQYYKLRATGVLIVMGLSTALAAVAGGVVWLAAHTGPEVIPALAAAGFVVSLITNTAIGRWLSSTESGWAIFLVVIPVVVVHYVLVWPMQMLALKLGWVSVMSRE